MITTFDILILYLFLSNTITHIILIRKAINSAILAPINPNCFVNILDKIILQIAAIKVE